MSGKFYSVGVGPGDFEYMTLKAKRIIESADIIAAPVKAPGEKSAALDIAKKAADISGKPIEELVFSMSKDKTIRLEERRNAAEKIAALLDTGKTVAMITLGDVSLYSTCSYISEHLIKKGFETETAAGVPAFSACAAKARISLCGENETLAVIPAVTLSTNLESIINSFDNIVIMKAGKNTDKIYECLKKLGLTENAVVTSSIGMENELIEPIKPSGKYGYFTTVIIKKQYFSIR